MAYKNTSENVKLIYIYTYKMAIVINEYDAYAYVDQYIHETPVIIEMLAETTRVVIKNFIIFIRSFL